MAGNLHPLGAAPSGASAPSNVETILDCGIRELFPDEGPDDALASVRAALRALEPGRARASLAEIRDVLEPTTVTVVEHLAYLVEQCWWPGGTLRPAVWDEFRWPAQADVDVETFWWGEVVPQSLFARAIAGASTSDGDSTGAPTVWDSWEATARAADDAAGVAHVRLLHADVLRRVGQLESAQGLAAELVVDAQALPGVAAARLVLLGDLALTPTTSPETLGSTLSRPLDDTRLSLSGVDEAAGLYEQARTILARAGRDAGVAAADLRLALVARLRHQPDDAAQLLDAATQRARAAGDGAGVVLALVHRELLALAQGGPVGRPDPIPQVESWITGGGSPAWVQGCARVALAAADRAADSGTIETALDGYALAARLSAASGLPGLADLDALVGDGPLLVRLRSHGLAASRWEEVFAAAGGLELAEVEEPVDPQRFETLATALTAMAVPMRWSGDTQGLRSVAGRARLLLQRAPGGPREPDPSPDVLERMARPGASGAADAVRSLSDLAVGLLDVARLRQAEHAAAEGDPQGAEDALATLARTSHREDFVIRALVAAGRDEEARARAESYLESSPPIGRGATAELWLLVGDAGRAQAVLDDQPADDESVRRVWEPDWAVQELQARVAAALGRHDVARAAGEEGLARVERWFAALRSDTFRLSALDDDPTRRLVSALVVACVELGDDDAAFRAADRLRSLALGALLEETGSPEVRAWRQARAEWNGAVAKRREAWRSARAEDLASTAAAVNEASAAVEQAAAAWRVLGGDTGPQPLVPSVTAAEVAASLDPGTVLLHQTLAEGRLVTAVVTHAGARMREVEVAESVVAGLCHRVQEDWSTPRDPGSAPSELAALLFDPVADILRSHCRLLVVPCAPALGIPFAALPFDGSPLVVEHTVSQLPAAWLVPRLARQPAPQFDAPCLVVGNPPSNGWRPLPGAEVEATLVHEALGGRLLVGAEADEPNLRAALGTRAPIVHLACHGAFDAVAPDLSELALAGDDILTVAELLGIGLDVDLAVLSACSSGRGRVTRAGELVGLQRGLLAAGVKHSVTSSWNVPDDTTCVLMTDFARHLREGSGVAEGLATAQRNLLDLTEAERDDRYRVLVEESGADIQRIRRGGAGTVPRTPLLPLDWAPWVHLGV